MASLPRVLCIGGVDSSGGAGLDADRAAALHCAVDVTLVTTANTEQDAGAVHSLGARDPQDWLSEAREALPKCATIKFGLLPGLDHLVAAAQLMGESDDQPWILDPLIASSSGYRFLDDMAVGYLREHLMPFGPILTPNLPEAAVLTGRTSADLESRAARQTAARTLLSAGASAVILKGGHGREDPLADLLAIPGHEPLWIEHPRAPGSRRGTGCHFATALAAHLARGDSLEQAARGAGAYVGRLVAAEAPSP